MSAQAITAVNPRSGGITKSEPTFGGIETPAGAEVEIIRSAVISPVNAPTAPAGVVAPVCAQPVAVQIVTQELPAPEPVKAECDVTVQHKLNLQVPEPVKPEIVKGVLTQDTKCGCIDYCTPASSKCNDPFNYSKTGMINGVQVDGAPDENAGYVLTPLSPCTTPLYYDAVKPDCNTGIECPKAATPECSDIVVTIDKTCKDEVCREPSTKEPVLKNVVSGCEDLSADSDAYKALRCYEEADKVFPVGSDSDGCEPFKACSASPIKMVDEEQQEIEFDLAAESDSPANVDTADEEDITFDVVECEVALL